MPDPSVISPHALLTPVEMGRASKLAAAQHGPGLVTEDLIPPIPPATHASFHEECAT